MKCCYQLLHYRDVCGKEDWWISDHKICKSKKTWKLVLYLLFVFLWNHNTLKTCLDLEPNYITSSYCLLLFKWLFSQLTQGNIQIQKNCSLVCHHSNVNEKWGISDMLHTLEDPCRKGLVFQFNTGYSLWFTYLLYCMKTVEKCNVEIATSIGSVSEIPKVLKYIAQLTLIFCDTLTSRQSKLESKSKPHTEDQTQKKKKILPSDLKIR